MQEQVIAAALFEGPVNDAIVRLVGTFVLDQLNSERAKVEMAEQRIAQLEHEKSRNAPPEWVKALRYVVLDKHENAVGFTFTKDQASVLREAFKDSTIRELDGV